MWYKVIKYFVWALLTAAFAVFGIGCILLYKGLNSTVYDTPFGKVDTDTLKIGLVSHGETKPCYLLHREIKGKDTLTYYFQPSIYYYVIMRDSLGQLQIWEWDNYNKFPSNNVTNQFKERDIIIR